jgi:hypothetical protein
VPRELMFVPFGVGQFANGQRGLGAVFLALEAALTVTCATTFALHQSIYPTNGRFGLDDFSQAQLAQGLELTNWISTGLLGAMITLTLALACGRRPFLGGRHLLPSFFDAAHQHVHLVAQPRASSI